MRNQNSEDRSLVLMEMEDKKTVLKSVWQKVVRHAQRIGQKTVYAVMLMFYAFKRKETPRYAKGIIFGVLGYFLAPLDAIPDLSPIIGYTDDLGLLGFGLVSIAAYINDEVRIKARKTMKRIFKELDFEALNAVERKL